MLAPRPRVLIVDDSSTARNQVRETLALHYLADLSVDEAAFRAHLRDLARYR